MITFLWETNEWLIKSIDKSSIERVWSGHRWYWRHVRLPCSVTYARVNAQLQRLYLCAWAMQLARQVVRWAEEEGWNHWQVRSEWESPILLCHRPFARKLTLHECKLSSRVATSSRMRLFKPHEIELSINYRWSKPNLFENQFPNYLTKVISFTWIKLYQFYDQYFFLIFQKLKSSFFYKFWNFNASLYWSRS